MTERQLFGHGGRLYATPDDEPELAYAPTVEDFKRMRDTVTNGATGEPPDDELERERRQRASKRKSKLDEPVGPSVVSVKNVPEVPKPQRDLREPVSTIAELSGITALTVGFFMLAPWVGLVVLGVCLVILGVAMSPRWDRE